MADDFAQSSAPHFRQTDTTVSSTLHRLIALGILLIFPLVNYGFRVVIMLLFGVLSAVGTEAVWNAMSNRPQTLDDLTAVEIGVTCALLMPARADYWLVIFAVAAAVAVGKMPFGGTFHTPFVPSAVGYCLAAVCFPDETFTYSRISEYVVDKVYAFRSNDTLEAACSQIAMLRQGEDPSTHLNEYFLGEVVGPLGTTSVVLLLMAGLWLYMSGNLAWQCVVSFSLATAVISFGLPYHTSGSMVYIFYDLLGGSTFFCCVFMAACPHYCPKLATARYVWGGACGVLSVLIQHFGSVEAGGPFAVLLLCPFASAFDRMVWYFRSRGISYRSVKTSVGERMRDRMKTRQEREWEGMNEPDEPDETE